MRSQQRDRLGEFVARASPPEFLVRNVALVTIRKSEIVLTRLGEPIELVLRYFLREPIAAVFGEVEPAAPTSAATSSRGDGSHPFLH